MKKLLISISLLGMCLFGAFPAEFSLGGYVGSVVDQRTQKDYGTRLSGLPQFGITLNVDFENFGFNTIMGIDFWASSWKDSGQNFKASDSNESILITPYIPFRYKKFMFTFGPTVGLRFNQYKFFNISLATFKDFREQEDGKNELNDQDLQRLIEMSILQQIMAHEKDYKLPESRLKKITVHSRKYLIFCSILICIFALSFAVIFFPNILKKILHNSINEIFRKYTKDT